MARSRIEPKPEKPSVLAFYLPQFHPIPENDEWWGQGFTEWRNVVRGHAAVRRTTTSPTFPASSGFYDLRMPEIREAQAALAEAHGITGFCYYHYWFSGRRILESPFNEVLRLGPPGLPVLPLLGERTVDPQLGRRHAGRLLIAQRHSAEDDRSAHPLADRGRSATSGTSASATDRSSSSTTWARCPTPRAHGRDLARGVRQGRVGDPFLVRFDTFGNAATPYATGFDAAAEFLPHDVYDTMFAQGVHAVDDTRASHNLIYDYEDLVESQLARPLPAWTRYQCVLPNWDNTPRKPQGSANLFLGSTPEKYETWLGGTLEQGGSSTGTSSSSSTPGTNGPRAPTSSRTCDTAAPISRPPPGPSASIRPSSTSPGVHRGRRRDGRRDDAESRHPELYEELKASSAREIDRLLRQVQELEDRWSSCSRRRASSGARSDGSAARSDDLERRLVVRAGPDGWGGYPWPAGPSARSTSCGRDWREL